MDNAKIILSHLTLSEVNRICADHGRSIITLTQRGDEWIGNCPTGHKSDSKKCFNANEAERKFHCHSCKVGGDFIHLVQLIIFGEVTKGKSQTINETFKILSARFGLGSPGIIQNYKERRKVFDVMRFAFDHYHAQFMAAADRDEFLSHYGLTEAFAIKEKIGFGGKNPYQDTVDKFSEAEALSTGLFYDNGNHIYQDRFIFPYEVRGELVYSIGRRRLDYEKPTGSKGAAKYKKQLVGDDKNPHVSHQVKNAILVTLGRSKDIVITEGITDYLALKQNGIHACSPVTTSFQEKDSEEIIEICKNYESIFIANDNEDSGAGSEGASRTAGALVESGIDPYIIELPLPDGKEKIDVNEYFRDKGSDAVSAFEQLQATARPYLEILIEKIHKNISGRRLIGSLKDVISLISHLSEIDASDYLKNVIKKRFKDIGTKEIFDEIEKQIKDKRQAQRQSETGVAKSTQEILDRHKGDDIYVSSGQSYERGILYFTVTRNDKTVKKDGTKEKVVRQYIVTSDKNIMEIVNGEYITDEISLRKKLSKAARFEYWSFNKGDYSTEKFLKNEVDVKPDELFKELKKTVKRHLYYENEYDYDFVAVALMSFPVYKVFGQIGYVHSWGEKRTGKSSVLKLAMNIGFNSDSCVAATDAVMFRLPEIKSGLMVIDEAEFVNPSAKEQENMPKQILDIMKTGHEEGAVVQRCGKENEIEAHNTFCPKWLAGTIAMEEKMKDRTITITAQRAPEGTVIEDIILRKVKPLFQELRDKTYCYALQHVKEIDDVHLDLLENGHPDIPKGKVTQRVRGIWSGYISTAAIIDSKDSSLGIVKSLLSKIENNKETRLSDMNQEQENLEVIELLYKWILRVRQGKIPQMDKYIGKNGLYLVGGVMDFFITAVLNAKGMETDYSQLDTRGFNSILKKYGAIKTIKKTKVSTDVTPQRQNSYKFEDDLLLGAISIYREESEIDPDILAAIQDYKDRNKINITTPREKTIESEGLD